MIRFLKRISLMIIISIAIEAICLFLQSNFLVPFLVNKIVEIQITLIAINTATSSFIVSKLQEISKLYDRSFKSIYEEIKLSLFEQIALIVFSILCLTIRQSSLLMPLFKSYLDLKYIFGVFMIFSFICSIDILRDTGAAMFNILIELDKKDN